jgi:glyoxylase-like metal-dependent hydrolase (beta-lactamase superfamily II)
MRAQAANANLQTLKLRDGIYMISGAGGNMVALDGPDGKVLVDSSFSSVAAKLRQSLDSLSSAPLKILVNTHWHFDHTDGNAPLHDAGALILAHENTRKRLSTPQYISDFGSLGAQTRRTARGTGFYARSGAPGNKRHFRTEKSP